MKYFVQVAVYREEDGIGSKSRTLLRGVTHDADTESDADQLFHEVVGILRAIARRRKKSADQAPPSKLPAKRNENSTGRLFNGA